MAENSKLYQFLFNFLKYITLFAGVIALCTVVCGAFFAAISPIFFLPAKPTLPIAALLAMGLYVHYIGNPFAFSNTKWSVRLGWFALLLVIYMISRAAVYVPFYAGFLLYADIWFILYMRYPRIRTMTHEWMAAMSCNPAGDITGLRLPFTDKDGKETDGIVESGSTLFGGMGGYIIRMDDGSKRFVMRAKNPPPFKRPHVELDMPTPDQKEPRLDLFIKRLLKPLMKKDQHLIQMTATTAFNN